MRQIMVPEMNAPTHWAQGGLNGPLFYGLFYCLAVYALLLAGHSLADELPDSRRQSELVRLVRQDCGSCHGMTLSGGLGPSLLPAVLRDKPSESLVATILYGRPATPMPPWGAFLSENEAKWIVDKLQK
jgi:cytochrome c55X